MAALERLLDCVGDPLDDAKPHPMVTLEEFFTDNVNPDSIGSYARARFSPAEFYSALADLRATDGFHDIRVEVLPELTTAGWPRADTAWIISDFDRRELPGRLTRLFWDGFLPSDWLSYPRLDGVATEPLAIPQNAFVFGFGYS